MHKSPNVYTGVKPEYNDMQASNVVSSEQTRSGNEMPLNDIYAKLAAADIQATNGQTLDAASSLQTLREKYNV